MPNLSKLWYKNFEESRKNASSCHSTIANETNLGVDLCAMPISAKGHVAFALAVDYFTKWPEAAAIKSEDSVTVAQLIYDHIITRHSCRAVQINDQGWEFVDAVNACLYELIGVARRIMRAYHPQTNGLVECGNRTVQRVFLNGALFSMYTSKAKQYRSCCTDHTSCYTDESQFFHRSFFQRQL